MKTIIKKDQELVEKESFTLQNYASFRNLKYKNSGIGNYILYTKWIMCCDSNVMSRSYYNVPSD